MAQYIKHGLRLSTLAAAIALAGCGEDFKDCGGTWDKLLGRSSCVETQTVKNTTVSVQLAPTATQGKTVEIVSAVDAVPNNARASVQLDTQQRDTVMALVDGKIALFALKYDEKPVELTPASTAVYLVLQLKGMLSLPDAQLKRAVSEIQADADFLKLVSYVNYKVQSGYKDPLNVDLDYALMKLVVSIANRIDVSEYQNDSLALLESNAIQEQYRAAHLHDNHFSLTNTLLGVIGISSALAGNEKTTLGNNELVVDQPENNNVKFKNFSFNPFFAYVDDNSKSGKWQYIAGRDSILEFSFDLKENARKANIKPEDGFLFRTAKLAFAATNVERGNQESTVTLNGIQDSGEHRLYVESKGICQVLLDTSAVGAEDFDVENMTDQQVAAAVMNAFSLWLTATEVALSASAVADAKNGLFSHLRASDNLPKSNAQLKKLREQIRKARVAADKIDDYVTKIKYFQLFLKGFVAEVKKHKEDNKEKIENELLMMEGLLESVGGVLELAGSVNDAIPPKNKTFLQEIGGALGEEFNDVTVEAAGGIFAKSLYAVQTSDASKEGLEKIYDYSANILQTSEVAAVLSSLVNKDEDGQAKTNKNDSFQMIKLVDAIAHNSFFQELFLSSIKYGEKSALKLAVKKGFAEKAKQYTVGTKAAALTWGIGTKLLPMIWDSCFTSNKLSIAVKDGNISNYEKPKIDVWIEDIATKKPIYWNNTIEEIPRSSGSSVALIQGRHYRLHVKTRQAGVLDRSRDGTDAAHQTTYGFRSPVKLNSIDVKRIFADRSDVQMIASEQLCVRSAIQDGHTFVFGHNQFFTEAKFGCTEGGVGSGNVETFAPPFNQTNTVTSLGLVRYTTQTWREGSGFLSWEQLTTGNTKQYGFGGEFYRSYDFTEDDLSKTLLVDIDGFNDESSENLVIKVINTADAVIQSNAQASAANPIVYVGEAITAQVTQVVGKVVSVFWQLINSLGEVVKGISAAVADSVSFATTDLSGGAYEIKAELRDENAEPIGVVSQVVQLAQTTFQSVNVHSMPVGVPVAITVYGKDLPSTAVFALYEGVPCGQPVVAADSVTQVCTATEAKNNVKLTVKRKTMVDEGSRIFSINITPKTVTGQFVVPANSAGVEFIPPVDNEPVVGTLGQVLEYGASRRNMTCSFKATGTTKTYSSYDLVDANGYATTVLPLHNGLPNMALVANDALIGVEKTGVAVKAGERLSFKLNDNEPADNEGALTVAYSCEEVAPTTGGGVLTATGITLCGDASQNGLLCTPEALGALYGLGQDGEVQAGQKMSYTVLNRSGDECVQDNVTGLVWEQKTDDGGLRDKDWTYTWYNPNSATNGGFEGYTDSPYNNTPAGQICGNTLSQCNTQAYVAALNAANYCGYSDWRMPTRMELSNLVDFSRVNPSINPVFVDTQNSVSWSASAFAGNNGGAWYVNFNDGYTGGYFKNLSVYVRAVRAGQ